MKLLDSITLVRPDAQARVEFYQGDLSAIPPALAADVLVVSALRENYVETASSLVGALGSKGLHVGDEAESKAVDLLQSNSCWLSQDVESHGLNVRRLLCFEPRTVLNVAEVVSDIFSSLITITTDEAVIKLVGTPIKQVMMPLVCAGDSGNDPSIMLRAILEAFASAFQFGLSIERLAIVEYDGRKAKAIRGEFANFNKRSQKASSTTAPKQGVGYDIFLSYSRKEIEDATFLKTELQRLRPTIRVFQDVENIETGMSWLDAIFGALRSSRIVILLMSSDYFASRMCQLEMRLAQLRWIKTGSGLFPIYLRPAELPDDIAIMQFEDCLTADKIKLTRACEKLLKQL